MSYIDKAALIERFSTEKLTQLTDRFGDGDLDDDVLNEAIDDARRTIDAYVSPRYVLPLAQSLIDDSPLPRLAGDLVIYFLQGDLTPEEVERRYRDAMKLLRDIQMGKASLGPEDTVTPTTGRIETRCGESANYDWGTY